LAAFSTSPADFISKYKEASGENCRNLAPMLEVLHGIASQETTKKFLASKVVLHESGGIKALKEKLLQQVCDP
jgi:hypothetical protein